MLETINKDIFEIIHIIIYVIIAFFLLVKLKKSFGLKKNEEEIKKKTIEKFLKHIEKIEERQGNKLISVDLGIKTSNNRKKQENTTIINKNPPVEFLLNLDVSDKVKKELMKVNFNENIFLSKVEDVIEIICDSITQNSFEKTKEFITPETFSAFSSQLEEMKKQDKYLKSNLISILSKKIENISIISNKYLSLDLYVESEQINFIENKEKKVVDGSKKTINLVKEKWVFTKLINSLKSSYWLVSDIIQLPSEK